MHCEASAGGKQAVNGNRVVPDSLILDFSLELFPDCQDGYPKTNPQSASLSSRSDLRGATSGDL